MAVYAHGSDKSKKLVNVYYENGKLYAYDNNEELEEIKMGGMPSLDYSNPLHSFTSGNLSYTAIKECYLMGSNAACNVTFTINGTNVGYNDLSNYAFIPPLKLSAGDTVVLSAPTGYLHVFDVKS